jgi:hypothetical protein
MKLLSLNRGCFTKAMATTKSAWRSRAAVLIVTLMVLFTGFGKLQCCRILSILFLNILITTSTTTAAKPVSPPLSFSLYRRCRSTSCFPPERLGRQFCSKSISIARLLPNKRSIVAGSKNGAPSMHHRHFRPVYKRVSIWGKGFWLTARVLLSPIFSSKKNNQRRSL